MDILEKNHLVHGILKKSRDVFRSVFHNTSQETACCNELEKNLKPDLIKIKK